MQKDYIMRMVEQFVQAILAIMRRRKNGEYKEARELPPKAMEGLMQLKEMANYCAFLERELGTLIKKYAKFLKEKK